MNLFLNALYFLFCISWTLSFDMSAPLREEIFDSSKQSRWTYEPQNAWSKSKMQLGKDSEYIYQACNPEFKNYRKTLWTNWIPRQDARELLLDLSFAQTDRKPLEIYVRESNLSQDNRKAQGKHGLRLAIIVEHPFPDNSVPHDKDWSHPKSLELGRISDNGFYLGFSYSGSCIYIASIQVFFRKCPAFAWRDMEFKETAAGARRTGVCVNGAVPISTPTMECQSNGTWGPPCGSCSCDVGYQADGKSFKGNVSFTTPHGPLALVYSTAGPETDSRPVPPANSTDVITTDQIDPIGSFVLAAIVVVVVLVLLFLTAGFIIHIIRRLRSKCGGQERELIASFGVTQYRRSEEGQTDEPELVKRCRTGSSNLRDECGSSLSGHTALAEEASQCECGYEQLHADQPQLKHKMSDSEVMEVMKDLCLKDVLVERTNLKMSRKLGKGEFGVVYKGTFTPHKGQDIRVAVKTAKGAVHSKEDLESFLKEAEIMMHFNHVNVVKLLGVALERDPESSIIVPLVILPYMKHRDLQSFLKATRYNDLPMFVPHQSLLRFMIDIAAGMEYLSLQGFIHRDLAARNCMLGDDLRVCVADFGLSKRIYCSNYYRLTSTNVKLPVRWMAIESVCDLIFTTQSDVWSFGITMWEITSRGKIPYPGLSNHEILDFLEKGHRLSQGDNDSKLYEVMRSCWHTDPSQRPGFGELGRSLKALLSELPALEASEESHYINLGLQAASHRQDSAERQEQIHKPKPDDCVIEQGGEEEARETVKSVKS